MAAKKTVTRKRVGKKVTPGAKPKGSPDTTPAIEESIEDKKKRTRRILTKLKKIYPKAECALIHRNPYQLLIATILSAQSTDETVNKVTPILFRTYRTPAALAKAPRADVEKIIHSTGFFRQKAKSIQGAARSIVEDFGGEVPPNMDSLISLPGVARKTANVVLGTGFGINDGVVVDTHIGRLSTRLAMTWRSKNSKDAVKIERDLMEIVPRKEWTNLGHALIWHGRKVCDARKPRCDECDLDSLCPSAAISG